MEVELVKNMLIVRGFKSHLPHMLIISGFEFRIMNWKEFLRPTILKIVVLVLVFLFTPFPFYSHCYCPEGAMCAFFACISYWQFQPIVSIIQYSPNEIFGHYPNFVQFSILYLVISYFLSCFIASIIALIYNKIRKK
jgi:hypothetical protein